MPKPKKSPDLKITWELRRAESELSVPDLTMHGIEAMLRLVWQDLQGHIDCAGRPVRIEKLETGIDGALATDPDGTEVLLLNLDLVYDMYDRIKAGRAYDDDVMDLVIDFLCAFAANVWQDHLLKAGLLRVGVDGPRQVASFAGITYSWVTKASSDTVRRLPHIVENVTQAMAIIKEVIAGDEFNQEAVRLGFPDFRNRD